MFKINTAFLKRFKSAPSYLKMPAAALDISDHSIKYMDYKINKDGSIIPENIEKKIIKDGIIVEGDIQDVESLAKELGYFRKKYPNKNRSNLFGRIVIRRRK